MPPEQADAVQADTTDDLAAIEARWPRIVPATGARHEQAFSLKHSWESGSVNACTAWLGTCCQSLGRRWFMLSNLKAQLEAHNGVNLPDEQICLLNHLDKGNVFDKAKILRDRMALPRDDGTTAYIQFLNTEEWCRNRHRGHVAGHASRQLQNRYDADAVDQRPAADPSGIRCRGMELKEAFNQVNRLPAPFLYWPDHGLFQYVQLFVISNGNTKYYANNRDCDFNQTLLGRGKQADHPV